MPETVEILEKFGAWGLCGILLGAIGCLYRSMSALLEKRNEQFVDLLRESNAVLQTIADQGKRIERVLDRVEDRLGGG